MANLTTNAKLLLPQEYVDLATELSRNATNRIFAISLCLTHCPATDSLIREITSAAKRGVNVHVAADLLTFVWNKGDKQNRKYRTDNIRHEVKKAGGNFRWLGLGRVPYIIGRTHSKWLVIDDDVFSFGGVNLDQSGITERTDYIFHIHDSWVADQLVKQQHIIEKADQRLSHVADKSISTAYGTILLDNGQIGQSTIYQHAIKLAKSAKEITVVSQYCPTGSLAEVLNTKNARIYFNPKGSAADSINNLLIGRRKDVINQSNLYNHNKYLHAKFILATMPDGSKKAITGSHNFTVVGIRAGTREIALETSDQVIINQLENFWQSYVK